LTAGTSQNPDVYFQGRETVNPYYIRCPGIVQEYMDKFAKLTGRAYRLFDYVGAADAERVIVLMGSGCEAAHEAVERLTRQGEKVGVVKVRLYRPFDEKALLAALPQTVKTIAALDRTKEPGSAGEPLYLDCVDAVTQAGRNIKVVGGRYGLSSKEFTPAMVKGIFDELAKEEPKNHFTVGINDDVTHTSIDYDPSFSTEPDDVVRALFYGLGSDGTVGANKNSIKIIGEETPNYAQGYFVYDSKKAGAITVSHLRFGPRPIRSSYLIDRANFIGCHQFVFLEKYDILSAAVEGATFLLNAPYEADEVWDKLPRSVQEQIIAKKLKFYVINAYEVAKKTGMGVRINTIMQTCFFYLSGVLPQDEAIQAIKNSIQKTYGRKGEEIVKKNFNAVDQAIEHLTAKIMANQGNSLPVSAIPADGTWPLGTTRWEKRNIALEIPVWDPVVCIQCGKCAIACPHAAIRAKVYDPALLEKAPETFKSTDAKGKEFAGLKWTIQVAPEDCTGCGACVHVCPAKNKQQPDRKAINMEFQPPLREPERANYDFFLSIPDYDRSKLRVNTVKGSQLCRPLFEYSGACAGCGETPYVKLLTQLFGDRAIIGNATGCSSIACELLEEIKDRLGPELVEAIVSAEQADEAGIAEQRRRVEEVRRKLSGTDDPRAKQLLSVIDAVVKKSVWAVGGDGWAYDIGYGGLDHVLASGRNINVLVLDTQVYSNTGGQCSKASFRAQVAKFAAGGKPVPKKDLGMIAMSYGTIYVAQVAMGASDAQAVRAFIEADSYPGPSLIIAYSHCIAHGINMRTGFDQQKAAVACGAWPLYRYDPRRIQQGKNPLQLDSKAPSIPFRDYAANETRFKMLSATNPAHAEELLQLAQQDVTSRWRLYEQLASLDYGQQKEPDKPAEVAGAKK